jgi:hypothetical protein
VILTKQDSSSIGPVARSSLGEEMYKFELNADLRQVWLRLAKGFDAGMAEVGMHLLRNEDYSGSTPDSRSILQEEGDADIP